jgi:iron complex transport system substrate-binding protein
MFPPQRIICLTDETVETLYRLGEQDRIAGISGYCVRPPEARRDKPRVSAFTAAYIPKSSACAPTSCSASPTCRPTSSPR